MNYEKKGDKKLTVAILQPGYLPWLGAFDQINRSDVFVVYDDVQYDKHGWRNRNRIKTPTGPMWITVPVLHKGLNAPTIREIQIDNRTPWAKKHVKTIQQLYAKSAFLNDFLPEFAEIIFRPLEYLLDLNIALMTWMCEILGVRSKFYYSSELGIPGMRSERLLAICQNFRATDYLSGDSAKDYLDIDLFNRNGIQVHWQHYKHPVYPQLHGEFVSHLSAVDLIFNCGRDGGKIITNTEQCNS